MLTQSMEHIKDRSILVSLLTLLSQTVYLGETNERYSIGAEKKDRSRCRNFRSDRNDIGSTHHKRRGVSVPDHSLSSHIWCRLS